MFAVATPPGVAERAIVRTSGPRAIAVAEELVGPVEPQRVTEARLRLAECDVPSEVYAFAGLRSHTGEDVIEYHVPGGALIAGLLTEQLKTLGLVEAAPGEFTARAFLNGKVSLDQAEAVQATIAAESDAELVAAERLRRGELGRLLEGPSDAIARLLAMAEAAIDFSAEPDVTPMPPDDALRDVAAVRSELTSLVEGSRRRSADVLPSVVLVGLPNAGKSTLFNALVGTKRVVASDTPGTTRDGISADVDLGGVRMHLVDLPGIATFDDALDQEAADLARQRAASADVVVLVRDATQPASLDVRHDLVIQTKADLLDDPTREAVSAATGAGIDVLRQRLRDAAIRSPGARVSLNERHQTCVARAIEALDEATQALADELGDEVVALALRDALDAVGEVTGVVTPDDVLGRIFSGFCVGK
ncbi:MAG: GTPase [Planctomycetota bacterium]